MDTDAPNSNPEATFADLGLRPELLAALDRRGYETPSPIQTAAIPTLLLRRDLLGRAATGTGKTAAFALPLLDRTHHTKTVQALVLAPTRELATQVAEAIRDYGAELGTHVSCLTGGSPIGPQLRSLKDRPAIVVGTPGRVMDHLRRGTLDLAQLDAVVLDEADEMLEMGFAEDIDAILGATPPDRQTILFSATLPRRIREIASTHLSDPETIDLRPQRGDDEPVLVDQRVHLVHKKDKPAALGRILAADPPSAAIVFCKTRTDVDELTVAMNGRNIRTEALHGGMDQAQRDRVLARLRDRTASLLIATDVAARGLDIDHLSHVVNFDLPTSPDVYTHRVGRVGRAGRRGVAISLATPRQRDLVDRIARSTRSDIPVAPLPTVADVEAAGVRRLGESLRELLDKPEAAAGTVEQIRTVVGSHHSDEDILRASLTLLLGSGSADVAEIEDASVTRPRRKDRTDRNGRKGPKSKAGRDRSRNADASPGWVYVGAGRNKGIRPGDLVGAIANETGLAGSEIGPIRITEHHSVVGVPEDAVDEVVARLGKTTVKGKKVKTRRWTD